MKNLKTLAYKVKPTIPESNSLVVIDGKLYYYDENNIEYTISSSDGVVVSWVDIEDKPTIIASGETPAEARTAIGAGTSNLTIGTTAATAKAGNYQPTWAQVTGKPSTFAPIVGTTATTAKAGNYTPSTTEVVAALNAMTPEQIGEIQTLLGITPAE